MLLSVSFITPTSYSHFKRLPLNCFTSHKLPVSNIFDFMSSFFNLAILLNPFKFKNSIDKTKGIKFFNLITTSWSYSHTSLFKKDIELTHAFGHGYHLPKRFTVVVESYCLHVETFH